MTDILPPRGKSGLTPPRGGSGTGSAGYEEMFFVASWCGPNDTNVDKLNQLLVDGWETVRETQMSASGSDYSRALVLLRRPKTKTN